MTRPSMQDWTLILAFLSIVVSCAALVVTAVRR